MNQALSDVASSSTPEVNTISPEPKIERVSEPNSSCTVKSDGNTTVTELPGVSGLPKAATGNDMRL